MKFSKMYVFINFDNNTATFKQNFWKTKKLNFSTGSYVLYSTPKETHHLYAFTVVKSLNGDSYVTYWYIALKLWMQLSNP